MSTPDEDLKKLKRLAKDVMAPGTTLKKILEEVVGVTDKVTKFNNVPTSGNAVAHYKDDVPEKYIVNYQAGDMGNLVHELTHVAVNEAYHLDFVNYPSKGKDVPEPAYDKEGRRSNEAARQMKWMTDKGNADMQKELKDLSGKAQKSELDAEKLKKVTDKLNYGNINPHIEHDTVLNQILVWLFEWGYAPTPADKKLSAQQKFFKEVETVTQAAYDRRKKGNK